MLLVLPIQHLWFWKYILFLIIITINKLVGYRFIIQIRLFSKYEFFSSDTAPESNELNSNSPPINLDSSQFRGSMRRAKDEADKNCWSSPDGSGFMIRGKTYLKDSMKVNLEYSASWNLNLFFGEWHNITWLISFICMWKIWTLFRWKRLYIRWF